MIIFIKKIAELPDALNPNNIPVGYQDTFSICDENFKLPEVGRRFYTCSWWSTSKVVEIINANTFKTLSSVYEWKIVSNRII